MQSTSGRPRGLPAKEGGSRSDNADKQHSIFVVARNDSHVIDSLNAHSAFFSPGGQTPQTDRLTELGKRDGGIALQIGDRSGHAQHPVAGPG